TELARDWSTDVCSSDLDDRVGPPEPQPGVGYRPSDLERRDHRPADHAVPRGSRPPGKPAGGHRPRPADRRGDEPRTEGVGGRQHIGRAVGRVRVTYTIW